MLSFLPVDKRKLFVMKLFFEEFNLVFFTAERLAYFEATEAARFWRNFKYILYSMVKESTFLKGDFCIYKGVMDYFYILPSRFNLRQRI